MFVKKWKVWYNIHYLMMVGGNLVSENELLEKLQKLKDNNPKIYTLIKGLIEDMYKKENVK